MTLNGDPQRPPDMHSFWKRKPPHRELLQVRRVWQGFDRDDPEAWTVRLEPTHGGKALVTSPEWLRENCYPYSFGDFS